MPYLKPARRRGVALTLAIGATVALPLAAPQLTRRIVDGAISGDPTGLLVAFAAGYLVLAIAGQAAKVVTAWLATGLAWDATNHLREDLTAHALTLELESHSSRTPGEMIERVDGDVTDIAEFVVAFLLEVVATVLLVVGVVFLVILAEARIGIALVVYLTLVGVLVARLQRPVVTAMTRYREATAILFGRLEERFASLEDIRANGAAGHALDGFQDAAARRRDADVESDRSAGRLLGLATFGAGGATALVLSLTVLLYDTGAVTLGTAVLLLQYTQMLQRPTIVLVHRLQEHQKALAGLARVDELLRLRPTLVAPTGGGRPLMPRRTAAPTGLAVDVDRVSFTYGGGHPALHDVSLRLSPERRLGLVGHTGSGKSTLARLLVRLHDPTSGSIRADGIDLREVTPRSLRSVTTFVPQDVQLFTATVRDNLTLFRPDHEDDRLVAALEEVGLCAWVAGLPDGLDTRLAPAGADGAGLSAGEAQLLALARAFVADPRLVILDEPSSRLDPDTERQIEQAVERLLLGRTAVVIAHRLSSLDRMDEIAVLDRGRLVEHGPRDLLAADPAGRFGHLRTVEGRAR